jgi:hypothetical protein
MAVCIGFVRSKSTTSAWTRCVRPAARGGRLCKEHRDSLHGAVLGMLGVERIRQLDLVRKALNLRDKEQ